MLCEAVPVRAGRSSSKKSSDRQKKTASRSRQNEEYRGFVLGQPRSVVKRERRWWQRICGLQGQAVESMPGWLVGMWRLDNGFDSRVNRVCRS